MHDLGQLLRTQPRARRLCAQELAEAERDGVPSVEAGSTVETVLRASEHAGKVPSPMSA